LAYLRTMIELYIKRVTKNPVDFKMTAEDLGSAYSKWVRENVQNFPKHFPSLRTIYDSLSEMIHRGEEDQEAVSLVEKCKQDMVDHFEMIRLLNRNRGRVSTAETQSSPAADGN
jgi:hypothetical protein